MKTFLLGTTLLALTSTGSYAACISHPPVGNLNVFQCDSDNQATDEDDVKFFLNKATGTSNIDGSLVKNTSNTAFENIKILTDAPINQEGNGFAELHSVNAGTTANALHTVTFDPIGGSTLFQHSGDIPFLGFDGFFGRGQVDALGGTGNHRTWDGDVFLDIVFAGGGTQTLEFMGDTKHDDIGAIGFDEMAGTTSPFIDSVTMRLDSTGAWNEVKQFDFSVPGAVAVVPELRTWGMLVVGFLGVGLMGYRKDKTARSITV